MPNIVEEANLVCADVGANANKFIRIVLYDTDEVEVEYGRIGVTSTKEIIKERGKGAFEKKVAAKKKGKSGPNGERVSVYTESKCVKAGETISTISKPSGSLAEIARKQIGSGNSPLVEKLIERLVRENVHAITSQTQVTFNASTGQFQTPLGVVTPEGITEGRLQLAEINRFITGNDFSNPTLIQAVNRFLRIVPQNVGMRLSVPTLFPDNNAVQRQLDFLDAMEAASSTPTSTGSVQTVEKVFSVKMEVASQTEFDRIRKKYRNSRSDLHVCKHLDVKTVYLVEIEDMKKTFESIGVKVGNVQEYWHGTRSANVLSILKSGLKTSPPSTAVIAGKLFGNGIYFSDQSTKSLNYAYGYWSGSRDENCFMLSCHVAMGKPFTPTGYGNRYNGSQRYPVAGYDSTFAKGGESGVANNEMIVYQSQQVNICHLIEFSNGGK